MSVLRNVVLNIATLLVLIVAPANGSPLLAAGRPIEGNAAFYWQPDTPVSPLDRGLGPLSGPEAALAILADIDPDFAVSGLIPTSIRPDEVVFARYSGDALVEGAGLVARLAPDGSVVLLAGQGLADDLGIAFSVEPIPLETARTIAAEAGIEIVDDSELGLAILPDPSGDAPPLRVWRLRGRLDGEEIVVRIDAQTGSVVHIETMPTLASVASDLDVFRKPVPGQLTCGFDGCCWTAKGLACRHAGHDFAANRGEPVDAPAFGTLASRLYNGSNDHGYGNAVIVSYLLETGKVVNGLLAHLDAFRARSFSSRPGGQTAFPRGATFGDAGGTGYGKRSYWGDHVHATFHASTAPCPAGCGYAPDPPSSGYVDPTSLWSRTRVLLPRFSASYARPYQAVTGTMTIRGATERMERVAIGGRRAFDERQVYDFPHRTDTSASSFTYSGSRQFPSGTYVFRPALEVAGAWRNGYGIPFTVVDGALDFIVDDTDALFTGGGYVDTQDGYLYGASVGSGGGAFGQWRTRATGRYRIKVFAGQGSDAPHVFKVYSHAGETPLYTDPVSLSGGYAWRTLMRNGRELIADFSDLSGYVGLSGSNVQGEAIFDAVLFEWVGPASQPPATPSSLTARSAGGSSWTLRWTCARDPESFQVEWRDVSTAAWSTIAHVDGRRRETTVGFGSPVAPCFRIRSISSGTASPHSSAACAASPPSTPTTVLSEGFESEAPGWSRERFGPSGTSSWRFERANAHTGSYRARLGNGDAYENRTHAALASPSFSLRGYSKATISFVRKQASEPSTDFLYVEAFDGSRWRTLRSWSGTTPGTSWSSETMSLGAYAGQSGLRLRFRFEANRRIPGWGAAIDTVTVRAQ